MVAAGVRLLHPERQFFYFAFLIARLTLNLASQFSRDGFKLSGDQNIHPEFFGDGCGWTCSYGYDHRGEKTI